MENFLICFPSPKLSAAEDPPQGTRYAVCVATNMELDVRAALLQGK